MSLLYNVNTLTKLQKLSNRPTLSFAILSSIMETLLINRVQQEYSQD